MKKTLRIGGVPEHFNLPWHLANEAGKFDQEGIALEWTDYPAGTGAMCKDLRDDVLDIAIVLTEGAVADILKGNPSKIVQWYVKSPLIWGIHTGVNSAIQRPEDLEGQRWAISRYGSGSHLMAFVEAMKHGWKPDSLRFEVINNLDGAHKALVANEAEGFLWEKFTTKPLVDAGDFRRVGECPTPWPCFVVLVREEVLENNAEAVKKMLDIINAECSNFMQRPDAIDLVAERYKLQKEDVKAWYADTEWATDGHIDPSVLENVMDVLTEAGAIETRTEVGRLYLDGLD